MSMSILGVALAPHAFSAVHERICEENRKRMVVSTILAGIMLVAGVVAWTNLPLGSDPVVLEVQSMAFPELRSLIFSLSFILFRIVHIGGLFCRVILNLSCGRHGMTGTAQGGLPSCVSDSLHMQEEAADMYSHLSIPIQGVSERPAGWSNARLRFEVARLMQEERLTAQAQGELTDAVGQSETFLLRDGALISMFDCKLLYVFLRN